MDEEDKIWIDAKGTRAQLRIVQFARLPTQSARKELNDLVLVKNPADNVIF